MRAAFRSLVDGMDQAYCRCVVLPRIRTPIGLICARARHLGNPPLVTVGPVALATRFRLSALAVLATA